MQCMFRENFINYEQMNQIGKIEKSYSYTIPEGPHRNKYRCNYKNSY